MGFKERVGLLIVGGILIAIGMMFYYETGHFPGRMLAWTLAGVGVIISAIIIRPVIWPLIKYAQIIYVDKSKAVFGEGPKLTEEDVRIVEQVLKKMAFPYLGIDEEKHQTQSLKIVSRNMSVIVYFLQDETDNDEPNYVKVGKYLFAVKLNNEEMQMIKEVLSKYEPVGE